MTQENKELLLKDLCARLPYGVKCNMGDNKPYTLSRIEVDNLNGHLLDFIENKDGLDMQVYISEVKPYLFPLSSMTDEQKKEFISVAGYETNEEDCGRHKETYYYDMVGHEGKLYPNYDALDYLYKKHIDVRGLIPMGLANDATGLNIY